MYRCEKCRGTFAFFSTPGQCPLCSAWADVRCTSCGHTAHANEFILNRDRCPICGVAIPGLKQSDVPGWVKVFESDKDRRVLEKAGCILSLLQLVFAIGWVFVSVKLAFAIYESRGPLEGILSFFPIWFGGVVIVHKVISRILRARSSA